MNSGFECNVEQVFSRFMDLTQKEMTKTVKRALVAGAKELQKQTKENITSSLVKRNNPHWYDGKRINYNDNIEDAVRLGKWEGGTIDEQSTSVHIMGTRGSNSGTYRARFLEKGTKIRYAKKGRNRKHQLIDLKKPRYLGAIRGKWFFRTAQQQVIPNLEGIYMREIEKTINKLNNTQI